MPVYVTCLMCGATIQRSPSNVRKYEYCSSACRRRGRASTPTLSTDGLTALLPLYGQHNAIVAHAVVDASDAAWAGQWRWGYHHGYAERVDLSGERPQTVALHRELLGLPRVSDGRQGDHINRNRLDDRRSNLRIVPKGKNPQNMGNRRGTSSQYRGVSWSSKMRKWLVQVNVNGRSKYFGVFDSEEAAAERARAVRREHMPYAID